MSKAAVLVCCDACGPVHVGMMVDRVLYQAGGDVADRDVFPLGYSPEPVEGRLWCAAGRADDDALGLLDHRHGGQPGLEPGDGGVRFQSLVVAPQVSLGYDGVGLLQGQLELGADGPGLLQGGGELGPACAQLLTLLP